MQFNQETWLEYINRIKPEGKTNQEELKEFIVKAIEKNIPNEKFGILFSGGIDSTLIAFICKKLKKDFICYTVGLDDAEDVKWAKKVAKEFGFKLKVIILDLNDIEKVVKKTIELVGTNVIKVGVGSVFYSAMELAKKDKIKYLFSGLGSEEIFAGYERHLVSDVNKECWKGLRDMYERDLSRDYAIANKFGIKILTPFLDKELIEKAMLVPGEEKINKENKKIILRKIAEKLGIPKEIAWRKKKAAQYGSKIDNAIEKLAKKNGFKYKSDYLNSFLRLAALVSGGKDSIFAMYKMFKNVKCIVTIKSKNPDSYMYHTPEIDLVKLQAESIGLPLILKETKGEKEKELDDLKIALKEAIKKYDINGVVCGALYSNYQKERLEKVCKELKLELFAPLWHMDQESELREILKAGFKFRIVKTACEGLDESWLREITEKDIDKLVELSKKYGFNPSGEGGEYESLVIDGPIFKKKIMQ